MKAINMEKVYKTTKANTKKIKVGEALVGLQSALNDIKKNTSIVIDDDTYNMIITYYSLHLLSRVHDEKEYQELFDSFLEEVIEEKEKESEA